MRSAAAHVLFGWSGVRGAHMHGQHCMNEFCGAASGIVLSHQGPVVAGTAFHQVCYLSPAQAARTVSGASLVPGRVLLSAGIHCYCGATQCAIQ